MKLPANVCIEFTGTAATEAQTRTELLPYSGLPLALILMTLFLSFHWRGNSWRVMANLPFSLIGSVFAIEVTGIGISLGSVVADRRRGYTRLDVDGRRKPSIPCCGPGPIRFKLRIGLPQRNGPPWLPTI